MQPKPLAFDIETNAVDFNDLPSTLKTIHCLVIGDTATGEVRRYSNNAASAGAPLEEGLELLENAPDIAGQNIVEFDIPAIQVLYPEFKPKGTVWDTKTMSKTVFPNIKELDFNFRVKFPDFPGRLIGTHKLEAWGLRMGFPKDDYSDRMKAQGLDPWASWNQMMEDYCVTDVEVTMKLWDKLMSKGFSLDSLRLEHDVRRIVNRQEAHGFYFDTQAAAELAAELTGRHSELTMQLQEFFGPFYPVNVKVFVPKRDNRKMGYVQGAPLCKVSQVTFNPASRAHIANRLRVLYGWRPKSFTEKGAVVVDESVLEGLDYEPVPLLLEYLMVEKRLGQLVNGNEAWMRWEKNGRIHGRVDTMGAVTSRMTHSKPNVAQVPANDKPYGKQCRALFCVPKGKKLVGCDADALELRLLAGYMAGWDKGEYIAVVLDGKKEDGSDIHTRNKVAIGLDERDTAKTWFYAFIYGAGGEKLGIIIWSEKTGKRPSSAELARIGEGSKKRFMRNLPALGNLTKAVKKDAKEHKRIRGLDGRYHPVRSQHAALNTLLQGAGAIVMKRALVIADDAAQAAGFVPGVNYEWVGNIHDELQAEVDEDRAEEFGAIVRQSLEEAGKYYNFPCPITGEAKIGDNWSETH